MMSRIDTIFTFYAGTVSAKPRIVASQNKTLVRKIQNLKYIAKAKS